jgi:hypothetical protein
LEALANMEVNVNSDVTICRDDHWSTHLSAAFLSVEAVVSIFKVEYYEDGVTGLTQSRIQLRSNLEGRFWTLVAESLIINSSSKGIVNSALLI